MITRTPIEISYETFWNFNSTLMSRAYHDYIREKRLYLRNEIEKWTKSAVDQFRF